MKPTIQHLLIAKPCLCLAPTNWVNAPSGTNNTATVPATLPARFYRLFKL